MKVHLVTHWTLNPELWAQAHGCDPSTCALHLCWDLSAAIEDLPIYRDHADLVPRDAEPTGIEPDRGDGLVRWWMSWTIEATAQRWREGRATLDTYANVPQQRRAYDDLALLTARELFGHAQIWEADAVIRVHAPFAATWTREDAHQWN
ncbi:hypothetical protein ACFOY4_01380 [Actinomadura syzygii]|uniref:Uncharacterized protein n=1 Tax=Actinomadura syzygii TaxID=1427538 RepID=A0A5D0TUS1_9ACTN|nr:hypothetical protein [Actinomadura syzygii]TYC08599.1 hypothetical protein FXF65_37535 [Actinomadura syzygii]